MIKSFTDKSVVVQAVQWTGHNYKEIIYFIKPNGFTLIRTISQPNAFICNNTGATKYVSVGDWIVQGVNGDFYPCKPDIFEQTYAVTGEPRSNGDDILKGEN